MFQSKLIYILLYIPKQAVDILKYSRCMSKAFCGLNFDVEVIDCSIQRPGTTEEIGRYSLMNASKNTLSHGRTYEAKEPFSYKKEFSKKGILQTHEPTHTGERLYKCDFCDYASPFLSDYKLHKRTHTGERRYKCDLCDYASANSYNLKMHQRLHTGEYPHKCDVCGYASANLSNLKRHQRTHTGERSYKCSFCDFATARSSTLNYHIKLCHEIHESSRCVNSMDLFTLAHQQME